MNFAEIKQRISDQCYSQNERVIDNLLILKQCCQWADRTIAYQKVREYTDYVEVGQGVEAYEYYSIEARSIHKELGSLRACRCCWGCLFLNAIATAWRPVTDQVVIKQEKRKPKPPGRWRFAFSSFPRNY